MLEVDFFRTSPIRELVKDDFDDFHVRIVNPRHTSLIQMNMCGYRLRHRDLSPFHALSLYDRHIEPITCIRHQYVVMEEFGQIGILCFGIIKEDTYRGLGTNRLPAKAAGYR